MTIALVDSLIRSVAAETLAEALDAAERLKRARLLLRYLANPELAGKPLPARLPPPFGESGSIHEYGEDRAFARSQADAEAMKVRDAEFGALRADVEKH